MSTPQNIFLKNLKTRIREDDERSSLASVDFRPASSRSLHLRQMRAALRRLEKHIFEAEQVAQVGLHPPEIARFRGWKGKMMRLIGRVVQRVANFITREQRRYNHTLLECISDLQKALYHMNSLEPSGDVPRQSAPREGERKSA